MKTIGYVSRAAIAVGRNAYEAPLAQSAENNRRLDVTGLLLYQRGYFIQVLEGRAAALDPLYARITEDSRHRILTTFLDAPIAQRVLGLWSMGGIDEWSRFAWLGVLDARTRSIDEDGYKTEQVDALRRLEVFLRDPEKALAAPPAQSRSRRDDDRSSYRRTGGRGQ